MISCSVMYSSTSAAVYRFGKQSINTGFSFIAAVLIAIPRQDPVLCDPGILLLDVSADTHLHCYASDPASLVPAACCRLARTLLALPLQSGVSRVRADRVCSFLCFKLEVPTHSAWALLHELQKRLRRPCGRLAVLWGAF